MTAPLSRRPIDAALARAGSLSDTLDPASQSERDDVRRDLQAFLAELPARVDFTGTRRLLVIYLLLALFGIAFSAFAYLKAGSGPRLPTILGLASLGLLLAAWFQRNAAHTVFMTLDQHSLQVTNLTAPLDLLDVAGVTYVDTRLFKPLVLALRPGAEPPPHRRGPGVGAGHAVAGPGQLRVISGGYGVDGKRLDGDQVLALFARYQQAAQAHRHLAELDTRP